jgi:uncharacterized protein (DUF1800 family)
VQPFASAIAANRFGLGARPGELSAIGADPRGWLMAQLSGGPPLLNEASLAGSARTLADALKLRRDIQAQRQAGEDVQQKLPQFLKPIYVSEVTARFTAAVASERSFVERVTQFWSNHFAVSVDKQFLAGLAGSFEREAIRPHVLGNFTDLLLAAETHPAMLLYLDNHLSVGPHSLLAQRAERHHSERKIGINENLAREILELHTLGVGSGYTQKDVTTFAQVLTGWSIGLDRGGLFAGGEPGRFLFREALHEPGSKVVLGRRYADEGFEQGVAVLRDVARTQATARFIATKLARHFVADDPPPQVVQRLADAFLASHGDLPHVYRELIDSHEAWEAPLAKYKTPSDYIISSYRGLAVPIEGHAPLAPFELLGQRTWQPGSPAGWPDRSADWDGASGLIKRIEWADAVGARLGSRRDAAQLAAQLLGTNLSDATRTALTRAASAEQAVTLLLAAPEFMRR